MQRTSVGTRLGRSLIWVGLCIYAAGIIYPFVWMFVSGFKTTSELFNNTWAPPAHWNFQNYVDAWNQGVGRYFMNSVIVTLSTVVLTIFISAAAAFAMSRFEFRGKKLMLVFVVGGLMLSPEVSVISLYKLLQDMKIYNTYLSLIIPYTAFRVPFTIFLLRSYFLSLPREVEESAYIDGCGTFRVFWSIVLPMSKPIIATASLLTAMAAWNEFMFGLVFIESDKLRTIPVGLMNLRGAFSTNWAVLLAGLSISASTMIVFFLLFQKKLIRGLTEGSVKG